MLPPESRALPRLAAAPGILCSPQERTPRGLRRRAPTTRKDGREAAGAAPAWPRFLCCRGLRSAVARARDWRSRPRLLVRSPPGARPEPAPRSPRVQLMRRGGSDSGPQRATRRRSNSYRPGPAGADRRWHALTQAWPGGRAEPRDGPAPRTRNWSRLHGDIIAR